MPHAAQQVVGTVCLRFQAAFMQSGVWGGQLVSCRVEVPRMLYATQQMGQLETYIRGSGDRELLRWWARYCESTGACGCETGGAVGICLDGWGRKGSDGLAGEHA